MLFDHDQEFDDLLDTQNEVNTIYGDMMTFLMSLFILLFVLSYNQHNDETFFTQMRVKFGAPKIEQQDVVTTDAIFVSKIQGYLKKEKLDEKTAVLVDEQKITLLLDSPILYKSGDSTLSPEGKDILRGLADIFRMVKNPVIIEGHTDNVPISTRKYESNWELSFHRAYSILKFFIHEFEFSPKQLSAIGYGEHQPLVPNDSVQNRARNRRIAINIIRVAKAESTLYND